MKLDLDDLLPQDATLELSERPGKVYHLGKITLRVKIWIKNKFGLDQLKTIFEDQHMPEVSEIAYYILKEKDEFKTLDDFQDAVVTPRDIKNLMAAMLQAIGISEPLLQKLTEGTDTGNAPSLSPTTGANSSTSLPQSTDTPSTNS